METQPLVSILINNYNYGRFLGAAIDSALAQTYPHVEVIVVDDGSTDDSAEKIRAYGSRITPLFKQNGGQASTFNEGFRSSRGSIICFLDADDLFTPDKVARILEVFREYPAASWAFDIVREFDHQTGQDLGPDRPPKVEVLDVREAMRSGRGPSLPTATSGLCFQRDLLQATLPMPDTIRITSDGYLKWTAMALSPGVLVHERLTLQRIHGANLYTKRKAGKLRLSGEMEVNTAAALIAVCPEIRYFAIKLLSRGIADLWASGGLNTSERALVRTMLRAVPLRLRAETLLRSGYWAFRQKIA